MSAGAGAAPDDAAGAAASSNGDGAPDMSAFAASLESITAAAVRIKGLVHRTPVMTCSSIEAKASGKYSLFFKCEVLQKTGSFKARGACNAVMSLSDEAAAKGVVTHSSGNHGQATARAAQLRGVPAYIVMPDNAPAVKKAAVEEYGATIITCKQAEREATTDGVIKDVGATFVHPSNDPVVISGQGTMALELLEQVAEMSPPPEGRPIVDAIIVPLGGGGMCSGVAIAAKSLDPRIRIIAAEPELANDAYRSKAAGRIIVHDSPPDTVADGLRVTLGSHTFPVVGDLVERVICVSEEAIIAGMRTVWERMKLAVEPSAGTGVAALMSDEFQALEGMERVAIVLSGGNIDLDKLPWMNPAE